MLYPWGSWTQGRKHLQVVGNEVCSRNATPWPEAVIEQLVGRQGQPRGAQVHALYLNDQKGWSRDSPLPRPHLRVGSRGDGILLEIPVYLWPLGGKLWFVFFLFLLLPLFFFIYSCCIWNYTHLLQPGALLHCCCCCVFHHVIALHGWFSSNACMPSIFVDIYRRFLVEGGLERLRNA